MPCRYLPRLSQQRLELGEGFCYEISMRKRILSRANVVASGNSVEPTPLSAAFPSALCVDEPEVAPCSMRSIRGGATIRGSAFGKPATAIPHPEVAGNKRGVSATSVALISPFGTRELPSRQVAMWRLIDKIHAPRLSLRHNYRSPHNGPSVALDLPRAAKVPMSKYLCCRLYR